MHQWILVAALSLSACVQVFSQNAFCEADWFNFRLEWAGHYERIEPVYDHRAIVWRDGLCGISDREGNLLLPIQYREQSRYPVILRNGKHFAGMRNNGSVWTIDDCDHVSVSCNPAWIVGKNGLQGLRDSTLQHWILPPKFIRIACYDKYIYATDTSGHNLEFDYSGRRVDSSAVTQLSNGLFIRWNDKRHCALAGADGSLLTDYIFQHLVPVCDGSFWATLRNTRSQPPELRMWQRFQHYDAQGKPLPDPPCQSMLEETDGGMIKVVRSGRHEVWDTCGQQILPGASWAIGKPDAHYFEDPEPPLPRGFVLFKKDSLLGVFLNAGKTTIPPHYRRIYAAPGKIIACLVTGGTDWYDRSGKLLRTTPDSIVEKSDPSWRRFFIAGKDGLMGVIDAEGREVIPPKYRYLRPAGGGCYTYREYYGEHLLNPSGEEIPLPPGCRFDRVCGNYILFRRNMVGGLTDLRGRMVLPPRYDWLSPMNDNSLFYFKGKNDLYGLVNVQGDTILPEAYLQRDIIPMSGYIFLKKDSLIGVVDYKGRLIQPFEYTDRQQWNVHHIFLLKNRETFVFQPADGTVKPAGFEWKGWMPYGVIAARRGGQWGLLRSDLTAVLPFEYDTIFYKENHVVARRNNRDQWYNEENGVFRAVEVDRVLEAHFWTILFERNGKKGLKYPSGDTLPAIYDQIVLDYERHVVLATLKDGVCNVPGSDGQSGFSFPADSLRSFYIPYFLQYWHRGEAWLMNTANGAKRRMELLTGAGEENKYMIYAEAQQSATRERFVAYRVREGNRERYVLLDSLLQDRVPAELDIDPKKYIFRPDGKLMLRIVRNRREGLWDVDERRWVFPCTYDAIEGIILQTDRYVRNGCLSHVVSYPSGFVRLRDKGHYGLGRVAGGPIVLPLIYDGIEIYITKDSLLYLSKNGKYGLYRPFEEKLLPPVFDNRPELEHDRLISLYTHPDNSGYADNHLNIIVPPQFLELEKYGPYIAARADSLWGFYDRRGNLVQPHQYSRLNKIEGSNKLVVEKQGKWMLLDEDLQTLGDAGFDFIDEDLLPGGCLEYGRHGWDSSLNCNVLWRGLVDTFGHVVLRAEFRSLFYCNGDRFVLADSAARQFGIFSADMRMLVPFVYEHVRCTRSGHFLVKKGEKYGLLDRDGRPLIEPEYDDIEEGDRPAMPYVFGKNGRYAFADRNGRLLTAFEFDFADGFRSGRAAVRRNGLWGYADSTGQVVVPLQYTFADKFGSNGRAWVLDKDKWLQINPTGKATLEKAPFNFDHERRYLSDTAGLRDSYGRLVLHNDSLAVSRPEGAVCRYRLIRPDSGLRYGLMNPDGRLLTPRIFDAVYPDIRFNHAEILPVRRGARWGYLHVSGKMTIPFQFEKAAPFDRSGQAEVVLNGKTFVIDMSGKCVKNCD